MGSDSTTSASTGRGLFGTITGTGPVVGLDLESFPLDRLVGFDGEPLKDVSHPKSRLLTKKEIARILRVEER